MKVHNSWQEIIDTSLNQLEPEYLNFLKEDGGYFPNLNNFLNAFKTLPLEDTKAILFGQDPYPREQSAIGYAFIDGMVDELFSDKGLSKRVNRATSLRNFMKMQLIAEGHIKEEVMSQESIASLEKTSLINSIIELKNNFEKNGVLLLNTSLIFTCKEDTKKHVKAFKPFIKTLLNSLQDKNKELILFGNMAKDLEKLLPPNHNFKLIKTVHPYNVSFIKDEFVKEYFGAMHLLKK